MGGHLPAPPKVHPSLFPHCSLAPSWCPPHLVNPLHFPPFRPGTTSPFPPPRFYTTPSPTLRCSHTSLVPPHLPLPPPACLAPQGKKGSVVGGCCSRTALWHHPPPPPHATHPSIPPLLALQPTLVRRSKSIPAFPFWRVFAAQSVHPMGGTGAPFVASALLSFLKSFPGTCQPQENPLGPANSTLCLKHLPCRQTSPPPFLGGRWHGVSP